MIFQSIAKKLRLPRNEDGSVAIEFAFIAPVLIIMYFGLFQVSMLIMEDRRVSHSASVLGDLVTREDTLDKDEVLNVFQGAAEVLGMSNLKTLGTDVQMQIVSLRMVDDGAGGTEVQTIGSAVVRGNKFPSWPKICVTDIDPRLLNTSSGAVVARVAYRFNMRSHADKATTDSIDTTTYIDPDGNGIMLQEQVIFKPRGPVDIPFTEPTSSDPDQNRHFVCNIKNNGKVVCNGMKKATNRFLTCND